MRLVPVSLASQPVESLLEREAEAAEISRLLDLAARGQGGLAVIEGPAGIGKTRLCELTRELAAKRGLLALTARGSELETRVAFSVVRQLLEAPLGRLDAKERARVMSGAASWAAYALDHSATPSKAPPAPDGLAMTVHGLHWTLLNLAGTRPALVCVDDAHWADSFSLRWLAYLVKRLSALPVMVVVGVRSEESSDDGALASILGDAAASMLHPLPLSRAATTRLLHEAYGRRPQDEFATACHEVTGGNPFLLRELITALRARNVGPEAAAAEAVRRSNPPSVSRFLNARMNALGEGAHELARAVAVLGSGALLSDAAALASLQLDSALSAASGLVRAGVLVEHESDGAKPQLDFKHPLLKTAVYGELELAQRVSLHRAAARVLTQRRAPGSAVAAHVLAAGSSDDPEVLAAVREAGARALASGAPDLAARYLRSVLQSQVNGPDPELAFTLGMAEARMGTPGAIEHLEQAFAELADPLARAQAGAELASAQLLNGPPKAVKATMEKAIAAAGEVDREFALRLEATLLPMLRATLATTPMRKEWLERASKLNGDTPGERALLAIAAADHAVSGALDAEAIKALSERAMADGQLLGEQIPGSPAVVGLAAALIFSDQLRAADRLLSAALEDASGNGSALSFALLSSWRSFAHLRRGEIVRGMADAEAAKRVRDEHGFLLDLPFIVASLANLLRESDEETTASGLLEAFPFPQFAEAGSANLLLHARGRSRVARGETRRGLTDLLACGDHLARWEAPNAIVMPWRSEAAMVLAALGEVERAHILVGEEERLARCYGAASAIGIALHARGLLAVNLRDKEELLRAAVAILERTEAELAHVRALISLGSVLRARGDKAETRTLLTEALAAAERLGAHAAAREARAELVASGARPRRSATHGVGALTPSERQIVELAASGRSNRQIAEALFLTVRTVEMHLTASYRKLGVTSRTQLPGVDGLNPAGNPSV